MTDRTWNSGATSGWLDAGNWDPAGIPQPGDLLTVVTGDPTIDHTTITAETILLGGGPVTLEATVASFQPGPNGPMRILVVGGDPDNPADVAILSQGTTHFLGDILVDTVGGGTLTIDAETNGVSASFIIEKGAFVLVTQESLLDFAGERIFNGGIVQVEGVAEIESGVTFDGFGGIVLSNGGSLTVDGTVAAGQRVIFADGKGMLTIAEASAFQAGLGFSVFGGDQILLEDIRAKSASLTDDVLTLYSGRHHQGDVVATLPVELVNTADFVRLPKDEQTLRARDFTLDRDGPDGTLVTYTPRGPKYLEASLPVPAIAEVGTTVSLGSLFKAAFGTRHPNFAGLTLIPPEPPKSGIDYWGQPAVNGIEPVVSTWMVNGEAVTAPTQIKANDKVALLVGNNIAFPTQIEAQVTRDSGGKKAAYVTYDVWPLDSGVAALAHDDGYSPGHPFPDNIVHSANSFEAFYGTVFNRELCNWIADNVAAGAGATMPLPDQLLDPSTNAEGGFWRIAYRGSSSDNPVVDWNTLVQPGDIVRLEWANTGAGHSTTVLAVNTDGTLEVYDNINIIDGQHTIGAHDNVAYWKKTDPAGITIYRLDPDQQCLIKGTELAEFMQGSVFDDLIRARPGGDTVDGSVGDDEIIGGRGADVVDGGAGDDTLYGGRHGDKLLGGDGNDLFVYTALRQSKPDAPYRDVIRDFEDGADRIDLSAIDAKLAAKGLEPFHFIGLNPFGHNQGELGYLKFANYVLAEGDADGDGKVDFAIKVVGVTTLAEDDFIL